MNARAFGMRAALLCGGAMLVAAPALAQQAEGGQADDTIVVSAPNYVPQGSQTATKTDAPLIETPQSISVITRDQIDLMNVVDVQQSVRYTAGIVGENYGPDLRFDFLTLRGFTPKQYIDGLQAPITTTIFNVGADIYGFESVDVLKGPSSVLYGNVPPGGIYNLVSRRASDAFGGEFGVKYGTDDYKQVQGTLTGPVADGLSARFTGLFRDRGSQVDFVDAQRIYAAPTFTWQIGERTSFTGIGFYQYDEVNGDTNGFLPAVGTLLPNPLGQVPISTNLGEPDYNRYERNQFAIGYDFSHEFAGGLSFQQNARWSEYKESQRVIYGSGLDADNRTVFRSNFPFDEKVFGFAIDNRLAAKVETGVIEHSLVAGVDYRNILNNARFGFASASSIDLFDPVYNAGGPIVTPELSFNFNHQRVKQTGVYAQDQMKIGGFILTVGGRYDWVKLRDLTAEETNKQDKFSYRAGINYVFESGFAPYVSYATSFEPVLGTDAATGRPFKPSTSNQIEAGLKYDARSLDDDVKLFATAALFRIKQKNLVSTQTGLTPVSGTQVGEVEAKGGELEIVARIREQLSFNASYSYTDTEVTKSSGGDLGDPLPTTPKHKLSGFVDYTIQQGPLGGLGFGVGGRYLSKSAGSLVTPFNPVVLYSKATTLFDAIVHYDMEDWRFSLNGSNIFDKKYVGRCAAISNCIYGQRRQVIVSVTRKF